VDVKPERVVVIRERVRHRAAILLGAAIVVCAAAPPASGSAWPWHPEPARYGVSAATEHLVTMSDGVQLAVDVYRPTTSTGAPAQGSFPVILSVTPYGKRSPVTTQSMGQGLGGDGYYPYLIGRGYIDVVADVRGSGDSGGDFSLFGPREKQDGVELVRWASRLSGSDGRVGMAGSSYLGLNQIFTAALAGRHSPLKAILPANAGNDVYRDLAFGGGIPNTEFALVWEGLRTSMTPDASTSPTESPQRSTGNTAARAENLAEFDANLYSEVDTGGPRAFDNDFWAQRASSQYLNRVVGNGVPALLLSGWHDVYQRGAVLNFAQLQDDWAARHGGLPVHGVAPMTASQPITGRYQLIVGPWFHNPATLGLTFQELQLAWFDRWLKGVHNGIDRTRTPLHVFELGTQRWVNLARWPVPQAQTRTLLLGASTLASRSQTGSDGLIWSDLRSPCNAGTDQWSTGLPAYAIAEGGGSGDPCADNDSSTQAGGVTYTSAPFKKATTVAGPIDVSLDLRDTAPDAEVLASLDVITPGGSSRAISSGALLGSLRALDPGRSWSQDGRLVLPWHPYTSASAQPMPHGRAARLDIEVYPTVARIAPGDRLRLTLTAGDTALQPSPVQISRLAGGRYSILRGRSFITVPMARADRLATSPIDWGGCNGSC
jgi:putative CocE/NonD family hydrolase